MMNKPEHAAEVERIRAEYNGWVPVELLLPRGEHYRWVTTSAGVVAEAAYLPSCDNWIFPYTEPRRFAAVIAWQPIPEQWKPEPYVRKGNN